MQSFMQYAPHEISAALATDTNTTINMQMSSTTAIFLQAIFLYFSSTNTTQAYFILGFLGMRTVVWCNSFGLQCSGRFSFGVRRKVMGLGKENHDDSWEDNCLVKISQWL